MVNFKNLQGIADKAKDAMDKRGGTDALKEDAAQLKDIAKGPGSLADKAKAAAAALKESGAESETKAESPGSPEGPTVPPPSDGGEGPKKAAGKAKTEAAEKAGRKAPHKRHPEEVGGSK